MRFFSSLLSKISLAALCASMSFTVVGCQHDDDDVVDQLGLPAAFTVLVDESFDEDQINSIVAAGNAWMAALQGDLELTFVVTPAADLKRTEKDLGIIYVFAQYPGDGYAGWAVWNRDARGAYIYMDPQYHQEVLTGVMKHEFGHAFHLEHYEGDGMSIMRPIYDPPKSSLTSLDIEAFCNIWRYCSHPIVKTPTMSSSLHGTLKYCAL